jgi:hypothetical protein
LNVGTASTLTSGATSNKSRADQSIEAKQRLHELAEHADLGTHGRGCLEGPAEGEATFEGREQMVGDGIDIDVEVGSACGQSRAQQVDERGSPGQLCLGDQDGTPLSSAVAEVDAEGGPDYYMVNCAHPTHIAPGLARAGEWRSRIVGLRANASTRSHAELDAATELDEGDPVALATAQEELRPYLPNLAVVGGCCGTDSRHVAAMWGVT